MAIRSEYIHVMFATCSLSVCYIFAMQKYGFCARKVWFLACKKGVFTLQKYGFCFLNVVLLQFVWNVLAIHQQHYRRPSAAVGSDLSRPHICVRHAFAIRQQHFGKPSAAVGSDLSCRHIYIRHPFCVCLVDIKSVLWQLCPLAKMVRLRWLCSVCLLVCRLFGYC